jgi:hypothetical protein
MPGLFGRAMTCKPGIVQRAYMSWWKGETGRCSSG